MQVFYHYTTHTNVKGIRKDGQINPSEGYYNQHGVWLTKMGPSHTKEEILWNNYEYDGKTAKTKLRRAACYVEINLPLENVMDLSWRRNHEGQDLWIWPQVNGPLVLDGLEHRIGIQLSRRWIADDLHCKFCDSVADFLVNFGQFW